jgi:hypothetical protein
MRMHRRQPGRVESFAFARSQARTRVAISAASRSADAVAGGSLASSAATVAATWRGRLGGLRLRGAVIPGQVQVSVNGSRVART